MIKDSIFTNPLPLLSITNDKLIKSINSYLPFSSAFEVECMQQPTFNIECFTSIPDIMDVDCDSSEQRFRVPSGLKGLVCLYNISEQLKLNSELDPGAGIHFHVDCTDVWNLITLSQVENNQDWILAELDTWSPEYTTKGRGVFGMGFYTGGWLKFNDLQTMEFRVGEMTFDYPILVKRMIHCNDIVRRFKLSLLEGKHKVELENLQKKLKELQEVKEEDLNYTDIATEVIKSRIKRI